MTFVIIAAAVILVLIGIIARQPPDFRITRTTTVSAPPAAVFGLVNDFHNWTAWDPWEKIDPALKRTYEGPSEGTGAIYSWVGNIKAGEGRMTILESRRNDLVTIKRELQKPLACANKHEFTFAPEGDHTKVTWSMTGKSNFIFKACSLVMNMDKAVGEDFEKGLAEIRSLAEAANKK